MKTATCTLFLLFPSFSCLLAQEANWFPIREGLESKWALQIDPYNLFDVYPRPSLEREHWMNLNGLWGFAVRKKEEDKPTRYERHILVPFAPESKLSGVMVRVHPEEKIWYRRDFSIPEDWSKKYIQLHFGASDYETTVYVNGQKAGQHRGGYDPFSFDITYFLNESGKQTVEVGVWDPTDQHYQARGKQKLDPEGIWYTAVSGIWQTVWLEPVESAHVTKLKIDTDVDASTVAFDVSGSTLQESDSVLITIRDQNSLVATGEYRLGDPLEVALKRPKLWTPEHPHLYDVIIQVLRDGTTLDQFSSYFGMRKVSVKKDQSGRPRIYLNNRPIFMLGVLDQGWWPAGLYTAPGIDALRYDIDQVKSLGYNTIRKHVKVEPAIWYQYCDEQGILVWQDMPNGDRHADWKAPSGIDGVELERSFPSEAQFKISFEAIVQALYNHPSILYWCPFNEGWGQFNTVEITSWLQELDPGRIVGGASGGNYFPAGQTRDMHAYPGPALPDYDGERALVLGEFGGLGYAVKSHLWEDSEHWSYQPLEKRRELQEAYIKLMEALVPLQRKGLCAAIYTQLSDVEGEINGLMTYDRAVLKFNRKKMQRIHDTVLQAFPSVP